MPLEYTDIPAIEQWKKDSSITLATRSKDVILTRIDELVDACGKTSDSGAWLYLATDLFFSLDYWLKIYKSNPQMEKGREPAVMALYKRVAMQLTYAFGCTINVLPRELELYFGREMGFHGAKLDSALDCAQYLKRSDTAKYKLWFRHGIAYQFSWWEKSSRKQSRFLKAESSRAYEPGVFDGAHRLNWGGFAMSMGRDIYMAKHHCTKGFGEKGNFYHSSYMGGATVMCAGTMLIEGGIIRGISTDSGHYRPSDNHIVNVLQALQMRGVNLSTIEVQNHLGQVFLSGKADVFLANRGNWASALARRAVNMTHLTVRLQESQEFENRIKQLWDDGVNAGVFTNDMPGRVFFAGVCLPNYKNRKGEMPFSGMNLVYALNALARATGRNPDAYEKWFFEEWTNYLKQNKAQDNEAGRKKFAQYEASQPVVSNAGWDQNTILDILKQIYKKKGLPWA